MTRKPALSVLPILLLCVVSCLPPLSMVGKASIKVSFKSAVQASKSLHAARTVVPPADLGITSISVTVTGPGGTSTGSVSSASQVCTISNIVAGSVTVSAVATDGVNTVASGNTSLTLKPGVSTPVTINLLPDGSGSGSFSFTMIWPDSTGATYVEAQLTGGVCAQSDTPTDTGGTYSWTYAANGVASGAYDMYITFWNAATKTMELGAFVESVNIYNHLTSNTWLGGSGNHLSARTFTAEEFQDSLTSLSQLVVTGAGLSNMYTTPTPGATIPIGMVTAPSISFTATLVAVTGQSISYTWDGGTSTSVGSGESSGQLTLVDGAAGNTLVITVISTTGSTSAYTVTMIKGYLLSYDANGATGGSVPASGLYYSGQTVTFPGNTGSLTRSGFAWNGWSTNPGATSGLPSIVMVAGGLTVYAVWSSAEVSSLTATAAATAVTLNWTNPAYSDFVGVQVTYYLVGNPTPVGTVNVTGTPGGPGTTTTNGLSSLTPYAFVLKTYDNAPTPNYSAGTSYWACPGGPVQSDFGVSGGVIGSYSGSATHVVIPGSINGVPVTAIGGNAFYDHEDMVSVTIPDSVTSIGDNAFYHCIGLTSVTIPNSVTSMGTWTFYRCAGLTSVTIPDSVTSIGRSEFGECTALASITIPSSITSIGESAFSGCSGLTSITIPASVTFIDYGAFANCSALTSVTIPNSVTSIGVEAFGSDPALTSVIIPNSVTCIQMGTFWFCTGLTSVSIPNSVTSIEDSAFAATGLTSVTLPDSVNTIGQYVFAGCPALSSVYVNATTPPGITTPVFDSSPTVHVPLGYLTAYQGTSWNAYNLVSP